MSRPRLEILEDRRLLSFITTPSYAVGISPNAVVVGDFNSDGIPDLAVANGSGTVSILLGKGDGTFQAAKNYAVGASSVSLAVADFNGDGHLDLAVANGYLSKTVNILLGNGDGTFQALYSYVLGFLPTSVAVGDFNGDGVPDLAVAEYYPGTLSIFLGKGDGSFQGPQDLVTGNSAVSVAVGDFNGDGILDLALANGGYPGRVIILIGKGDGTFQAGQDLAIALVPYAITIADSNGDGKLDIVAADSDNFTGAVGVLLGNGDGTFQAAQSIPIGSVSVAAGDFNGDGIPDLAVAGGAVVSVLLGNGNGSFRAAESYSASHPQSVVVGDFNGDGHLDLAVANQVSNSVSVLLGAGDGTFQAVRSYLIGSNSRSVAVADFNGDGIPDLVATNEAYPYGIVSILLGQGNGTFQAPQNFVDGLEPQFVAVGDFNGDGKEDLVTTNYAYEIDPRHGLFTIRESDVRVFLGNGDGTFRFSQVCTAGIGPSFVAVADVNADGIPDLVVANGSDNKVSVLLGNGDGTFQTARNYVVGNYPQSVAVGDFNGDGIPDLAVANVGSYSAYFPQDSGVSILLGKGDGTFQAAQTYAADLRASCVVVGDFNGDGHPDLAVGGGSPGSVSVLLNHGDGTFQVAQSYTVGGVYLAVGDFNNDGFLDLVASSSFDSVSVLLGHGDGTFRAEQSYAAGRYPDFLAVGDFNGDGYADLAVANNASPGAVTVLINAADWGGGHAMAPPRTHGLHPAAHGQSQLGEVFALLAGAEVQGQHLFPETSGGILSDAVQQWLVKIEAGQLAHAEATFAPPYLLTARHVQDALFERWRDAVADVLEVW